MSERLEAAYSAGIAGDLRAICTDLPPLPATVTRQRAALAERRRVLWRRALQQSGGAFAVFLLCCVICLASGAHGQFWPEWVAIVVVL